MVRTTDASRSEAASVAVETGMASPPPVLTSTLVLKREKSKRRKKGKKKYSGGTGPLQRLIYGVSRAGYRASNSFSEGLDTFVKRSNKSARKRRDGMMRDVLRNASRGVSDGLTELGKAPGEVARRIGTRRVWRVTRTVIPFGRN